MHIAIGDQSGAFPLPLALAVSPQSSSKRPESLPGQAPIVGIQLRFVETFYSGSKLYRMRDEIVHTVRIPQGP